MMNAECRMQNKDKRAGPIFCIPVFFDFNLHSAFIILHLFPLEFPRNFPMIDNQWSSLSYEPCSFC